MLLAFCVAPAAEAAKRDFKGLFGNYRRDKFIENEAKQSAFGVNILLSTLLPVKGVVRSAGGGLGDASLHYAAFFNLELEATLSLAYHWLLYTRIGYHTFQTEREHTVGSNVRFHNFKIKAVPVVGGVKYRFGRNDVVPYLGLAAGLSYVERHATYDFSNVTDLDVSTVLTGELHAGVEFYFGARAGLRLEVGGYYMNLAEKVFNPGGGGLPSFTYKGSPLFVRYASGLFIIF